MNVEENEDLQKLYRIALDRIMEKEATILAERLQAKKMEEALEALSEQIQEIQDDESDVKADALPGESSEE